MFGWLKRLLGISPPRRDPGPLVLEKPVRPKPVEAKKPSIDDKLPLPDFGKMSKLDIDIWARNEHGINLDRRYRKQTMIQQLIKELEEKS